MLMRKPGEDPIMTPAQLETLESDLRERAKPLTYMDIASAYPTELMHKADK